MCWNATTSIVSFIIGTILNIAVMISFKSELIYAICIAWQWVLMMQLSEYLIWMDQKCGTVNEIGTNSALIFNITQPIIVFLCLIAVSKSENKYKVIASISILLYICYIIYNLNIYNNYKCIKPTENCAHLNLKWWNDFKYSGIIFSIILSIIILCLSPLSIGIFTVFYIFLFNFISMTFYGCGGPSMWCWFVVIYPLFLALFYKYYYLKNNS